MCPDGNPSMGRGNSPVHRVGHWPVRIGRLDFDSKNGWRQKLNFGLDFRHCARMLGPLANKTPEKKDAFESSVHNSLRRQHEVFLGLLPEEIFEESDETGQRMRDPRLHLFIPGIGVLTMEVMVTVTVLSEMEVDESGPVRLKTRATWWQRR
jgi:hypothetical protein